jgi:hypothetical protein
VSANQIERSDLEAEGDRVGADFRLGQRTGAWARRRHPESWGCGVALLFFLIVTGFVLFTPIPEPARGILAAVFGVLALTAVLLMVAGRRSWQERLFQYDQGIAQFLNQEPEPTVMRWTDMASLSLRVVTSYESHTLMSCVLRDSSGRTITVDQKYGVACEQITAMAQWMLGSRLAPTLIARYDAGEPVVFGNVIVDRTGISCPGDGSAKPWSAPWRDTRRVEMLMHGHRISIKPYKGRDLDVSLGGAPNDFLAQDVIAYGGRLAGVDMSVG